MFRQIPGGLIISTLFGDEVATKKCNTCYEVKYKHEFYIESVSKRRNAEQVRNQCIECWDRFKGDAGWGRRVLECEALENA
jgi:hypothetical protein